MISGRIGANIVGIIAMGDIIGAGVGGMVVGRDLPPSIVGVNFSNKKAKGRYAQRGGFGTCRQCGATLGKSRVCRSRACNPS